MRAKFLVTIFLLHIIPVLSQPVWHVLDSIPPSGSRYDDLFFLNSNLGWAADGPGAAVYKTTDSGVTWNFQAEFPNNYLRNIEFIDENKGFLGTLTPQFYKTSNGGQTWQLVTNIPGPIQAICGLDAVGNTIYGCGAYFSPAYIIKSTNAGSTWQYINMNAYADSLVEVLFINEFTGFAAGGSSTGGIVLKTIDGGLSWTEIYNSGIPGEYVWKLQRLFSNPNIIFGSVESVMPLNGKLIKSSNGGVSWISKEVPDTDIQAVGFITENHGWMGGHHTGFLETFDSGTTWIDTGIGNSLNRIQIFNESLAFCSGENIYKFSENLSVPEISTGVTKDLVVRVIPNPVDSQLNFSVDFERPDHALIRLFDANGKLLKILARDIIDSPGTKTYSYPFPYRSGVYYLNIHNDVGSLSEKIIKN